MTLSKKQQIFTFNIAMLIDYAFSKQIALTFGEVFRTIEQQKLYFDSGKSKTMDSRHLQRLAVDFNIFINDILTNDPVLIQPLGEYWMGLHTDNVWGGDWNRNHGTLDESFRDPYHFEMRP